MYTRVFRTNPRSLAGQILDKYSPAAISPAVSLVNHETGTVHNYNGVEVTEKDIKDWITKISNTQPSSKNLLTAKLWLTTLVRRLWSLYFLLWWCLNNVCVNDLSSYCRSMLHMEFIKKNFS